jgi:methionine-gamma-lyase
MTKSETTLNFDTLCVHAGLGKYEHLPVVPPIYQTSTFGFESAEHGAELFSGKQKGYIYTRMLNPTVEALENAIAELEGGHKGLGCGSGMAAVHTVFAALLKNGDHVVCSTAVYGPTITILQTIFKNFGVTASFVDTTNLEEVKKAITKETKIIYTETPGNPTLAVCDLEALAKTAHDAKALLIVDNTFLSPALQRPFELGADIVLHSLTKFLNGHADVIGGVIVVKDEETYTTLRKTLNQTGGVIDPFNSFLVHRGLKTLFLRMEKHCENATQIAKCLETSPYVQNVMFPGLPSHPQYELAKKQQKGPGGMIAFELKGGFSAGQKMMNEVRLCKLAVSLGGVETLIQHPASMTHFSLGEEGRKAAGISEGLIRLSVGIENPNDLIQDLNQAMQKAMLEL